MPTAQAIHLPPTAVSPSPHATVVPLASTSLHSLLVIPHLLGRQNCGTAVSDAADASCGAQSYARCGQIWNIRLPQGATSLCMVVGGGRRPPGARVARVVGLGGAVTTGSLDREGSWRARPGRSCRSPWRTCRTRRRCRPLAASCPRLSGRMGRCCPPPRCCRPCQIGTGTDFDAAEPSAAHLPVLHRAQFAPALPATHLEQELTPGWPAAGVVFLVGHC